MPATTRRPLRSFSSCGTRASRRPSCPRDGTNDAQFVDQAGEASKDAILSCPCGPAPGGLQATEYRAINGRRPGVYSVEGYDLTTIMLTGIDSGITDRAQL